MKFTANAAAQKRARRAVAQNIEQFAFKSAEHEKCAKLATTRMWANAHRNEAERYDAIVQTGCKMYFEMIARA